MHMQLIMIAFFDLLGRFSRTLAVQQDESEVPDAASIVALVSVLEMPFSYFWGWLFAGQSIDWLHLLGAFVVVCSVVLLSIPALWEEKGDGSGSRSGSGSESGSGSRSGSRSGSVKEEKLALVADDKLQSNRTGPSEEKQAVGGSDGVAGSGMDDGNGGNGCGGSDGDSGSGNVDAGVSNNANKSND